MTAETRIQKKNREAILDAGLEAFSEAGFRGATLDRIASGAGLSKPNLLYYFPSKEAIYTALLEELLSIWLAPLQALDPEGDPMEELLLYVDRKLALSRDYPRESRLFANEVLQGAPHILGALEGELRDMVDHASSVIQRWVSEGRIAALDPTHLIFSVWALTQHYADFDVQIRAVRGNTDPFDGAGPHLDLLFRRFLAPGGDTA
ncbi:TetR family transcriptional regulator C-terminal domain-containing protein [Pelagovum pacificum]|uniref:TetR family transcriptional regulator n=1 Tax=Pelagovum pacificum TaxID=2588711 RepID=A0A5C5GKT2_9RHOB|nr:TetR family transcriptional regulator C-terminal domain-containing protein [Pelagovum pacificum]QQA42815.1 TetR family transcriptional regulator C-terminal domain-containing protein [Pelagovum pacificum]TNY34036.1 TetR family transcriptional regulator [Pelagovum pacificum]